MLIQVILVSLVVPKTQELARAKLRSSNIDYFEGLIKPKKFNDTIKGLTIYAEDQDENKDFKNIYIKKNNSVSGFQITFAKKGVFENKGNKRILVLYDGQTLNQNGKNITNFEFSKSDFGLANMDSHLVTHKKLQEISTYTLINCLQFILNIDKKEIKDCYRDNPRNIYKELFKRLINPLYLPVLILVSLMLILKSKENLKYNKSKYIIFFVGFIIIILSESSLGYITDDLIKNISISIFPSILTLLIYLFYIYKLNLIFRKIL
jgi:lipopolysaccharide export system permease protein